MSETPPSDETALPDDVSLSIAETADRGEAAAIAAAVGTHLHDRAAAAASDEASSECDRWKLCGRLGIREPPRATTHGNEWKAAGRARR